MGARRGVPRHYPAPADRDVFDTSIDELLGLGEEKIKAEIEEWKNKSKELLFKGDVEANYDLWSKAYKKYPNDLDVIENYMRAMWDIFMKGDAKDKTLAKKSSNSEKKFSTVRQIRVKGRAHFKF